MPPEKTVARRRRHNPARPVFTVAQANAALVLVRKIVADIVARYHDLMELRAQQALQGPPADPRAPHPTRRGQPGEPAPGAPLSTCAADLNRLYQELTEVGCVLKDWQSGLVDFPALHAGQRVWLCWRLGEPTVAYWHAADEGFAGRQPIGDDFE